MTEVMGKCFACDRPLAAGATFCSHCGARVTQEALAATHALARGTLLHQGAFVIDGVLGEGGFAITYAATDTQLQRPVALKEFFPSGCGRQGTQVVPTTSWDPTVYGELRRRFIQEGQALARLGRHKATGIVEIHGLFEENGSAYLVMELLEGKNLRVLIAARGNAMPESEVLGYATQMGEALEIVHAAGLLHRDIKPENVVITGDRAVLIDFGTAREYMLEMPKTQSVILTPGFAPVEQYVAKAVRGPWTDVYGLSATLYNALTGQVPVAAPDRMYGETLRDVREIIPALSAHVGEAVMRGLTLRPEERPQTISEFMALLNPHGGEGSGGVERTHTGDLGVATVVPSVSKAPLASEGRLPLGVETPVAVSPMAPPSDTSVRRVAADAGGRALPPDTHVRAGPVDVSGRVVPAETSVRAVRADAGARVADPAPRLPTGVGNDRDVRALPGDTRNLHLIEILAQRRRLSVNSFFGVVALSVLVVVALAIGVHTVIECLLAIVHCMLGYWVYRFERALQAMGSPRRMRPKLLGFLCLIVPPFTTLMALVVLYFQTREANRLLEAMPVN